MRTTKPGKIPGFFASRSRANSMTIAERLIQKGFDEGFKEGFKQGVLEVAREIACRLRDIGWPPERIQEVTGLSGEELKKLFPDEQ
ncbi:TPA: Rpn family recombination-promoting nuclease/putative transposase [Escherichia coli]|nr:Rpn family recombination-promoting nuclease/putative transposase [Escherichia coli]